MQRRFGSFFYKGRKQREAEAPIRRRRGHFIARFLKKACFYVGALVIFSVVMGLIAGMMFGRKDSSDLPKDMILTLDVNDPIGERENDRSLTDPLASMGMTVADIVDTLDKAGKDKRVHAVVFRLNTFGIELSHVQELRNAVKRFRETGKKAYLFTPSFADLGSGIGAYYLAAAFDKIWMQPAGLVSITGVAIEMPFAKDALDKVGVKAKFLHREEYKSAMESFTNSEMSPANREMMTSILKEFSEQISRDIAHDRKLDAKALEAEIDKGLLPASDALKAGLIDRVDYADTLDREILVEAARQGGSQFKHWTSTDFEEYYDAAVAKRSAPRDPNVAIVRITGEIVEGQEAEPGFAPGQYIADAIDEAAEDKSVKVIVLRIDSPGGSPTASETIRHAVVRAKDRGKKILVSMGPLAASGGYWIAVDADRIFAMPSTLTGSIGVIMGKFELEGLWQKLGVNWQTLSWGRNAGLWSMNRSLDDNALQALNRAIDDAYGGFLQRVGSGRHMKDADVRKIAKGRAWTGLQGKEIGLVDEIGGLDDTLSYAAKMLKVKDRADLDVIVLPKPLSAFEEILHLMGHSGASAASLGIAKLDHASASILRRAYVSERIGPIQAYDPRFTDMRP